MAETGVTTIHVNDIPASVNAGGGGSRAHWSAANREKQRWEGTILMLLLEAKMPRNLRRVTVNVELQFNDPGRRRDVENYRHPVVKPLADSLTKGGYLPDDTAEFFEVGDFTISPEKIRLADFTPLVKRGMKVELHWER